MSKAAATAAASKKSENVRVAVRCRPLNSAEKERGEVSIVTVNKAAGSVHVQVPRAEGANDAEPSPSHTKEGGRDDVRSFTFDYSYGTETGQLSIFQQTAQPIVESVMGGYNGTIFAYGQTGTGKTHTMEGVVDNSELRGLMPNTFHYVFDKVSAAPACVKFLVRASFLEVYLDDVFDLLAKEGRRKVDIKESKEKGVYVKDLSEYSVNSVADMMKVLKAGTKQRRVGATKMNEGSSRSHSILTITVETSEMLPLPSTTPTSVSSPTSAAPPAAVDKVTYKVGKLHLVDLAGSERQKKTAATGERLDEAKSINWSLTVLGNCIKALIEPNSRHIPYRDSKLTRLLQDSLGGNTKTVMIANIGPAQSNALETIATLRYADRAKQIQNKPTVNADAKDTMLKEMQEEIARLKEMLAARGSAGAGAGGGKVRVSLAKMERKELMKHIAELPAEMIEERVEERLVEKETGWSEEDVREMRRKQAEEEVRLRLEAERERRAISDSVAAAAAEAQHTQAELSEHERRLQEEEAAMAKVAAALAEREAALLQGGEQVELARQQAMELQRMEEELRGKREAQAGMEAELAAVEEAEQLLASHAQTVEEELKQRTLKLKRLWLRYLQVKEEWKEEEEEWERERAELLEEVRRLGEELERETLVVDSFVPAEYGRMIEEWAEYDEQSDEWMIRGMEYGGGVWDRGEEEEKRREEGDEDEEREQGSGGEEEEKRRGRKGRGAGVVRRAEEGGLGRSRGGKGAALFYNYSSGKGKGKDKANVGLRR